MEVREGQVCEDVEDRRAWRVDGTEEFEDGAVVG